MKRDLLKTIEPLKRRGMHEGSEGEDKRQYER